MVMKDLGEVENGVSQAHELVEGRLRVDVPSPLARMIRVSASPAFHRGYPGIQIDMRVSAWAIDLLDENIHCVIRVGASDRPLRGECWQASRRCAPPRARGGPATCAEPGSSGHR